MKRIITAAVLTVSIIVLAFTGRWIAQDSIRQIQSAMEQIDTALAADDTEQALKTSEEFLQEWDRHHGRMCLFLQHDHLDPLENVFALLPFYIQSGEILLARAECKGVRTITDHILKTEQVTIENIL